jgi:hypothetical protein
MAALGTAYGWTILNGLSCDHAVTRAEAGVGEHPHIGFVLEPAAPRMPGEFCQELV